jgi:hypothetical protein
MCQSVLQWERVPEDVLVSPSLVSEVSVSGGMNVAQLSEHQNDKLKQLMKNQNRFSQEQLKEMVEFMVNLRDLESRRANLLINEWVKEFEALSAAYPEDMQLYLKQLGEEIAKGLEGLLEWLDHMEVATADPNSAALQNDLSASNAQSVSSQDVSSVKAHPSSTATKPSDAQAEDQTVVVAPKPGRRHQAKVHPSKLMNVQDIQDLSGLLGRSVGYFDHERKLHIHNILAQLQIVSQFIGHQSFHDLSSMVVYDTTHYRMATDEVRHSIRAFLGGQNSQTYTTGTIVSFG